MNADGSGVVRAADDARDAAAVLAPGNPLGDEWALPQRDDVDLLVAWSGTPGGGLFEASPLTWMPAGRAALDAFCQRLAPQLEQRGQRLAFRPHARHVLSDEPSCVRFLNDYAGGPFTLAFEPALLFEPTTLDAFDERLPRLFEALAPRSALVIVSDARVHAAGEGVEPVPLGQGVFPAALVHELVERYVPDDVPVVKL